MSVRTSTLRLASGDRAALPQHAQLNRMDDEDLMALFQTGSVQAFNILVDRYSDRVLNYLFGFVKDWRAAEDLLQDTLLRVHRNRHAYQRIAKFSTWLYTIAGNLARSEYRKRQHRNHASIHAVSREDEDYVMPIPDDGHLPDRQFESTVLGELIHDALHRIRDDFREVVVMRDVQQLTYDEIAEITGLPMGTVKSRINRGRTHLQRLLRDVYPFQMPAQN